MKYYRFLSIVFLIMFQLLSVSSIKAINDYMADLQLVNENELPDTQTFLGISLNLHPKTFTSQLVQKGFKYKKYDKETDIYQLTGVFCGVESEINVQGNGHGTTYCVVVYDKTEYLMKQAKSRMEKVIAEMETVYGKGQFVMDDFYMIESKCGRVNINLIDGMEIGFDDGYAVAVSVEQNN